MSLQINSGAALAFLLKQDYQRFCIAWQQVQEDAKAKKLLPKGQKEASPVPTWEEWLKQNELLKSTPEVLDKDGAPIVKE